MPIDLGAEYLHGLQTAHQLVESRQRLAAERERIAMEGQVRSQMLQQQSDEQAQRQQVATAYHEQEIQLAQQRLQEVEKQNAARTKEAALKMADQQGFAQDLAQGLPIDQALFRHPRLASPAAAIAAHKDALDLGRQRLDLANKKLASDTETRQRALDLREQGISARTAKKPQRIGETVTKDETGNTTTTKYLFGDPNAPAPPATGNPLPLPKSKDALKTGQLYTTSKGHALWNGEHFIPQSADTSPIDQAAEP